MDDLPSQVRLLCPVDLHPAEAEEIATRAREEGGSSDVIVRELTERGYLTKIGAPQGSDEPDVRLMIQVKEPGDTPFLPGQIVDRFNYQRANDAVRERIASGAKVEYVDPVTGENVERDFKEATRVLTEAVRGK